MWTRAMLAVVGVRALAERSRGAEAARLERLRGYLIRRILRPQAGPS